MKTRNTLMNALALVALAAGLAVVIAAWQTRRVQAIQDSEDFPSDFGFIDLQLIILVAPLLVLG
jgi:hypothetical protein